MASTGSAQGTGAVTNFVWDWASGVPELLSDGDNLYLISYDTLGYWNGSDWTYHLPDALGSIRQTTDDTGAVTDSREWTPFGVEVGTEQAGLGYTGEWQDPYAEFLYLRARWYDGTTGRFTQVDPWSGNYQQPLTMNPYLYALANPVLLRDPSGRSPWDDVADVLGKLAVLYVREYYPQELATSAQRFSIDRVELEAGVYTMSPLEGHGFDVLRKYTGIRQDELWAWLAWGLHTSARGFDLYYGCFNPYSPALDKQGRRADTPSLGIAQIDPPDAIAVAGYWAEVLESPNVLPPPGSWPNEWLTLPGVGIQYLAAYIGWSQRELERLATEMGWPNLESAGEGWLNLERQWWFTGRVINGENPEKRVDDLVTQFQLGPTKVDGYVNLFSYWEREIAPDNRVKTPSRYVKYMRTPVPQHLKLSNLLSSLPK